MSNSRPQPNQTVNARPPAAGGPSLISIFCFVIISACAAGCYYFYGKYEAATAKYEMLCRKNIELTKERDRLLKSQSETEKFLGRLKTDDEFKARMLRKKLALATPGEIIFDAR
jgi:hypothetical protein